jgi:hypothetical protein
MIALYLQDRTYNIPGTIRINSIPTLDKDVHQVIKELEEIQCALKLQSSANLVDVLSCPEAKSFKNIHMLVEKQKTGSSVSVWLENKHLFLFRFQVVRNKGETCSTRNHVTKDGELVTEAEKKQLLPLLCDLFKNQGLEKGMMNVILMGF